MIMAPDENTENQVLCGHELLRATLREHCIPENELESMNKSTITLFERLTQERDHWRRSSISSSQDANRLNNQVLVLMKDKAQQEYMVESLRRDVQSANSRCSAALEEQRELRRQWLAEKNDLNGRLSQLQAQNTQVGGTLKKKEKEFNALQIQLAKVVKDSTRGSKHSMIVSAPLRKTLSGPDTSSSTLRDAEITALKNSLHYFQTENAELKASIQFIENDFNDMQASFTNSKDPRDNQRNLPQAGSPMAMSPQPHTSIQKVLRTPGTIARTFLQHSPRCRSMEWQAGPVNEETLKLRQRAAQIACGEIVNNGHEQCMNEQDPTQKLNMLRSRLTEALLVIEEQDRLICQALSTKLPSSVAADLSSIEWEDERTQDNVTSAGVSIADIVKFSESCFSSASPESLQLLESIGWSTSDYQNNDLSSVESRLAQTLEFDD